MYNYMNIEDKIEKKRIALISININRIRIKYTID